MFDGDILKAFDYLKPSMISKMLREMKVPASLRAAWIKEQLDLKVQPRLMGKDKNLCDHVPFNATRQGAPDSMRL